MPAYRLNFRQYLELEKLHFGAFAPLRGFMDAGTFHSVVDTMRLPDGTVFPLPVVFDVQADQAGACETASEVDLVFDGRSVGTLRPNSLYDCDKRSVAAKVYGTADAAHPGVDQFYRMGDRFVGGAVTLHSRVDYDFSRYERTPDECWAEFARRDWKTVIGFQTRNVPHRAHEYLLRLGLELGDGLFIQPLIGQKKPGDYTPESVMAGYEALVGRFLPADHVMLATLSTYMRYAGPREAVFHAIIRRNYGCTHFIVGRDHAGVGGYYDKYAAHDLTRQFEGELGIEILRLHGPYHCRRCDGIVTERTCPHGAWDVDTEAGLTTEISGTMVREMLSGGAEPAPHIMRPEIVASLAKADLFIETSDSGPEKLSKAS
jgi:sulfate adenylyltransferase